MRSFEFRMTHADGETFRWFSQTNAPLRDNQARVMGIQGVAHDITNRRALQAQIAQAERLADLGRMAASIAHEIRNPLGAIVNSVNVLRRPGGPRDPRLMEIVTEEADRLDVIVREFLLFARPPARTAAPTDLPALIDDTVVLFRRDQGLPDGVDVRTRHAPGVPLAFIDARQIRQVLWNLLKNAGEAMTGPGHIDVETIASPAGDTLTISVTDDGPGVSAPEAVFEPFYTTRAQGTGLGLAVVARIVRDHSGTVTVHKVAGRGASFVIVLPLEPCAAGART